jgi:hypothetical protein
MSDQRRDSEQNRPHHDLSRLAAIQNRLAELTVEMHALHREIARLTREADQAARNQES